MKCPKCQSENPDTQRFCGECGTQIFPSEEISISHTETLETPQEELTTGSTFAGRYQIIEELGKGGMGRVYKALDTKIKEKVALKLLKPDIASDKKTIERFSNELKFARRIRHKNVCQMYDLNEEKGTHYITMEYVPGEDLKSMIRMSGQLSVGTGVSIAKQVCEGLAEAHRAGVVHRDLKPQNIMIDRDGIVRIMDFGIARSIKGKGITGTGVMIGTPEYMSPEQVEGKEVEQRSDIYSLGVILYEMVTGEVPFEGDTPFAVGIKHKSESPKDPKEINSQIPEDLSRVILKCMEKDKDSRYQNAAELRAELINIEKVIPTTERKAPRRKPITSREITVSFNLRKLLLPALVIVALVIAVIVIWQTLPQKEAMVAPRIENSVAVISFENQTGDRAYDYLQKAIPNLLITSLEQTGELYVVTWERLQDLLKQMGKKEVEDIDRDLGFKLCRMEGVEAVVLGSFVKAGNMFATDVKVLDVDTKRLLKSAGSRGLGEQSILETQIDELSREISECIGIARGKIEPAEIQVAEVTTLSMEAYKYFLKGSENIRKFYYSEAKEDLERAVELDPTFATAYLYLAAAYDWIGNKEARNKAIEKAKIHALKATEKERFFIEASYASYIERDNKKREEILQQIAEKYPREKEAYFYLSILYRIKGDYDKALDMCNKVLELDPNYGEVHNELGYVYIYKRDLEKSIEHFAKYASLNPKDANPYDSMADAYFIKGDLDKALENYKKVIEIKPDFYTSYPKIGYIYALMEKYTETMKWIDEYMAKVETQGDKLAGHLWKALFHFWLGNIEKCLVQLQAAEELAELLGDEVGKADIKFLRTRIYLFRGDRERSRRYGDLWDVYEKYYTGNVNFIRIARNFALGMFALQDSRIDSAREKLTEMNSLAQGLNAIEEISASILINSLHVEILLAEGPYERVDAILKGIPPLMPPALQNARDVVNYNMIWNMDLKARAYQQIGDYDKAIAGYERLTTFYPGSEERFMIHPLYHYKLARLYEEKGWDGKAIDRYEKFLEIWKNADPGIAEVEEAKKRLAELKK